MRTVRKFIEKELARGKLDFEEVNLSKDATGSPFWYLYFRRFCGIFGWKLAVIAYLIAAVLGPSIFTCFLLLLVFIASTIIEGVLLWFILPVIFIYSTFLLLIQPVISILDYQQQLSFFSHNVTLLNTTSTVSEMLQSVGIVTYEPSWIETVSLFMPILLLGLYWRYRHFDNRKFL